MDSCCIWRKIDGFCIISVFFRIFQLEFCIAQFWYSEKCAASWRNLVKIEKRSNFNRMGNKLGRRRQVVDEKYTRPQGLYQHRDVDHKKLRKLILDSKLAPCYPGDDDSACDLEECPICFLVCTLYFLFFFFQNLIESYFILLCYLKWKCSHYVSVYLWNGVGKWTIFKEVDGDILVQFELASELWSNAMKNGLP